MADGSVAIMQMLGKDTPQDCIAKWPAAEQAKVVSVMAIDPGDVPADRTFRNAWKLNGTIIEHDMVKAREIRRNQLRELRAPLLAKLDEQYLQADEVNDLTEKERIIAKKQALRDVTADPAIEAAKTPDALKRVLPAALR